MRPAREIVAKPGAAQEIADYDDLGLTFYTDPPNVEVSIREFEEFTCDRLKVLHGFDRLCGYDVMLARIPELRPKIQREIDTAHLSLTAPVQGSAATFPKVKAEFQRRDAISHFALRLAFCKTREAREWFARQEQRLFVLRFDALSPTAQAAFMQTSGLQCKRFDEKDREGKMNFNDIQKATHGAKLWSEGTGKAPQFDRTFYELPFFELHPSLIATRKVVLEDGKAYVPSSALKLILAARFKDKLVAGLDAAFQGLPTVLADPRVGGFMRVLQDHGLQMLMAPKASNDDMGEKLSLENFEELLVRSFPPCMRRVVEKQREMQKHLKHAGRLQLRPFLKDCGFTFEESLQWWRKELCKDKEIDATIFEKNYIYDVEHTYGKKGHFQGGNSFGCPKIIGFPHEAVGQVHGCPFKMDLPVLKQQLHRWRVPEPAVGEIEKLINNGKHYQLACIEYFKAGHVGSEGDGVGNSPNDFFRESCRCHMKTRTEKEGKSSKKPAAVPTQG